ncbi:MAG: hypothetical protein ABI779_14170, partial [Acidobacteriota bacterium]
YAFAGGDPVNGRDPLGLANQPKCFFIPGKSCGELVRSAVDNLMESTFGSVPSTGNKELDSKMRQMNEAPVRILFVPATLVAGTGESAGQYVDLMDRATFRGESIDWSDPENMEITTGAAMDVMTFLAPFEMLEGEFPIRRGSAKQPVDAGVKWGKGIQAQGMPWENYLEKQMPPGSRLPKNYKAFDFFADETGVAISAKTLDTTTAAKLAKPEQVYTSLTRSVDAAANFTSYELKGVRLSSEMITVREVRVAVPSSTNRAQWAEIKKAVEYGRRQNIKVIVTVVK